MQAINISPDMDTSWMDWRVPDGIERREVAGRREVRTPIHGWTDIDNPQHQHLFWEYIGWTLGLADAKRQERAQRLREVLQSQQEAQDGRD